jgi:WD40 repeat protein
MAGEDSLLELEHVVGYTGSFPRTVVCHPSPSLDSLYVTALGAHVVFADVYDPHKQTFLRGHDADVSALDVSSSGRFVASGQVRSPNAPAGDATVIVWEFGTRRAVYNFFGIMGEVMHVKFSPDEKFLAAAGSDMNLFVWDLATGEQVSSVGVMG